MSAKTSDKTTPFASALEEFAAAAQAEIAFDGNTIPIIILVSYDASGQVLTKIWSHLTDEDIQELLAGVVADLQSPEPVGN